MKLNRGPWDGDDVLSSIVVTAEESSSPGIASVTSFMLNGEKWMQGMVEAVRDSYHDLTGRPTITDDDLVEGTKVTLLRNTHGTMGHEAITFQEGTIREGMRGPIILPKGARKKGYRLTADDILDLEPGFNKRKPLQERIEAVASHLPDVDRLTQDDLAALPNRGDTCSLAVFGTAPMPDGPMVGAVYLCHSYMADDDIVENVLICQPPYFSEYGSILGADLLRFGAKVVGFQPISFKDALDLTDRPYREVLDFILSNEDANA